LVPFKLQRLTSELSSRLLRLQRANATHSAAGTDASRATGTASVMLGRCG
jgi:hypothetical protein